MPAARDLARFVQLYKTHGSVNAAHRQLGGARRQTQKLYRQAVREKLIAPARVGPKVTTGAGRRGKDTLIALPDFVKLWERHGRTVRSVARGAGWEYRRTHSHYKACVSAGLIEPRRPMSRVSRGEAKAIIQNQPREEAKANAKPVSRGAAEARRQHGGRVKAIRTEALPLPKRGKVARYLFTCAQNNSKLHEGLWRNLLALQKHYRAELHVSRFTYVKQGLGAAGDKAEIIEKKDLYGGVEMYWDARLDPYLSDYRLEIAPGLVWCGEMNILPTASRPLSGLESYTARRSGIFPHAKLAMESIAAARGDATKFNYTTGAVSLRNYIQRKAGLKAEFHHCYGALLVEVDSDGDWFCRQLNADSAGTLHDLDLRVKDGIVTAGHRVQAITWGDIHVERIDPVVAELGWSEGALLDSLRPRYQFMHDVLDFQARSHHEMRDPHRMFKRFVEGTDDVRAACAAVAAFLARSSRSWCKTIVVDSNHHHHLGRWLKEQDARQDPPNAEFWLAMQARVYAAVRASRAEPNYLREAVAEVVRRKPDPRLRTRVRFLDEDESFVLCRDAHGGIEGGLHGDLGPNGARGSALNLAKMGRRANIGHSHIARIIDGVFQCGTSSRLDLDWLRGPSAWSHSHTITYENGKRTILTMWNGKCRAGQKPALALGARQEAA